MISATDAAVNAIKSTPIRVTYKVTSVFYEDDPVVQEKTPDGTVKVAFRAPDNVRVQLQGASPVSRTGTLVDGGKRFRQESSRSCTLVRWDKKRRFEQTGTELGPDVLEVFDGARYMNVTSMGPDPAKNHVQVSSKRLPQTMTLRPLAAITVDAWTREDGVKLKDLGGGKVEIAVGDKNSTESMRVVRDKALGYAILSDESRLGAMEVKTFNSDFTEFAGLKLPQTVRYSRTTDAGAPWMEERYENIKYEALKPEEAEALFKIPEGNGK